MESLRIVDSHVHFAGPELSNPWADGDLNPDCAEAHPGTAVHVDRTKDGQLMESSLVRDVEEGGFNVEKLVYVECFNGTPLEEARWALKMASNDASKIESVVLHIPVPQGGEAVREFLSQLRTGPSTSALPKQLRGGRVVLLGCPMPPADACNSVQYLAGLAALEEHGLHWEWCCHHTALPFVAKVCRDFSKMTFVLDHLGRNGGNEDDVEQWKKNLSALAEHQNVVAKIGAIEEWGVADPNPLIDHAVACFGFQRLIFESNWFVSKACGYSYKTLVQTSYDAVVRNGGSEEDVKDVFSRNAERVYRLL